MKIKESPSIILAFHGMLGRKKQTSLLLLLLTLVFSFLTAAVIYSVSSAQVLQDTRCELYGAWQYLRLSDTAADAAQAQNTLPASAQVSTVIQNGIVLGADDGVAGGIGTVDDTFAQLGRIVPISGDFPTQSDEIAMTTTLLDALGCSYDVGQTVTLKVAANDYDPLASSGTVMEKAYTLCGVLPAYDVYWNLNGNLTVSGIVTEPLVLDGQKFQTFYYLNAAAPVTASTDPALVANEYAYPQEDTVSFSLRFLLVAAILVSFFAVAQYFLIVLHKRVHTINTFLTLGAKNRDLRLMCLWEALFAGLAAVAAGFALGCGAAAVGLGLQKHLSFLVVPAASLVPLAVLFLLSVLLGALLPAVLVRPQTAKPKEKPAKKFRLAQLPLAPQIGVGCAVLLIAVSCLYVGWRVMLPYDLDEPYACLSIKMNGTSGMPFSLKEDLAALPGVEEVSAAIDLTDIYTVTSDKIQSSQMLADIWVKDNGDIPSLIMQNASKGTLNTTVCALPDDELRHIAADAGVSDEEIETLLAGDSVLTLWRDCYYDPAADEYYQGFQPDGSTLVEPVFAAGDKLNLQYQRYTGQDEAGNEVYRTYTAQLPIAGVVKSASNYTLLTTDRIIFSGTIFVSTALYHKMFESAGSYFMEKEGYSSLNVKLSADSNFSLRRSISSIATRRNGILRADNYDLISQSYTEGTQSAFLVGILAVFGVLLGCALLVVLNLSAYEIQQQRLSLLLTLGVSPKKLVLSYAKLLLPVIGPYTAYLRVALILGIGLLAALWPRNVIRQMDTFRPNWRSGLYVLAWTVWAILSFTGVVTFIYSNF